MTDLVLINPNVRVTAYQDLGQSLTAIEPPLWCRLIAGYCLDRGWGVQIIDAEADELNPVEVALQVAELSPRLVAIVAHGHHPSASTQTMAGVTRLATKIRHAARGVPIIVTGGHVSTLPEVTLNEEPVDFACVGEGPVTIDALLEQLKRLGQLDAVPGLVWHDGQKVRINPRAPLLDVAQLHGRAWKLLPMSNYRAHNWQCFDGSPRQPYASIYTSLGCPFKCSFCCINAPFDSNRYRMRDPDDVVAEIAMLHDEYNVSTFKIIDEMFVLNRRHVRDIALRLAALPYADQLNIWAYARVDTITEDDLPLLRRAGFRWLGLGIESGSAHVRDGSAKTLGEGDIRATVRAIQAAGIAVIGNFIFGLPDDTAESMRATLDLACELNCEFVNLYSAMAYPGSALFKQATREGWRLPDAWSGYSQHAYDCVPLPTATLTSADVLRFRDYAFSVYFEREEYRRVIRDRFGAPALAQIDAMVGRAPFPAVTLRRRLLEAA